MFVFETDFVALLILAAGLQHSEYLLICQKDKDL